MATRKFHTSSLASHLPKSTVFSKTAFSKTAFSNIALMTLFLSFPGAQLAATVVDNQPELTTVERAELVELYQRSQAETLSLVLNLTDSQWHQRVAEGRWSIGETVEHLILAEGAIRSQIDAMLKTVPKHEAKVSDQPSLDELVALGSDRRQRFEAPQPIQPSGTLDREEALKRLLSTRAQSLRFVLETEEPLRSFSAMAPIGRTLDGHGWLALLGAHNLRHNRQIAETKAALGL